jgi:hypothetical protein
MNGKPPVSPVPPDWSYVQLKTHGIYQDKPFTVVGRLRLQLRNDYKSFWCAAFRDGDCIWIMESFASLAIFSPTWHPYNKEVRNLRAGELITLKTGLKLKGEYVEKCEAVSYEGEIGSWKLFEPAFFFIQAANTENETAIFTVSGKQDIEFLVGEKIEAEKLGLKNTIEWNEWK